MAPIWRTRLKRWGTEALVLLVGIVAIRACQTRHLADGPAPVLEVETLDGRRMSLGGASDEVVVLHFWATWCGVCRAEQDNVVRLAQHQKVISVASSSGGPLPVSRYVKEHELGFPVVVDEQGQVAKRYGVTAFPSTFFVDRAGNIVAREVGYTTTLGLYLRALYAGL